MTKYVIDCVDSIYRPKPTFPAMLGLAPFLTRLSTVAVWPFWLAAITGVTPICEKYPKIITQLLRPFKSMQHVTYIISNVRISSFLEQNVNSGCVAILTGHKQRSTSSLGVYNRKIICWRDYPKQSWLIEDMSQDYCSKHTRTDDVKLNFIEKYNFF